MNKRIALMLSAVAAALALSGCCSLCDKPGGAGGDPAKPQVTVKDGRISVSPEPLIFAPGVKDPIVWSLPKGSNYRFPENGIVIEGELVRGRLEKDQSEIVGCKVTNEGLEFTCLNNHTRPGVFKYTIRVLQDGRSLEPLDPTAWNW